MPKKTSIFEEQTRIPLELNIEKIWCPQKRTTIQQFLQISDHTDQKSTKEVLSRQKNQKQSIRCEITLGIQLHTFPSECNTTKLQSKTWKIVEKAHLENGGNYTHQYNEVKEKL